jgi:DNA topoisomerase-1
MTSAERAKITELEKCDFREMSAYYATLTEERKAMSKEEKLKLKEDKEREQAHYGYAWIDGHKQKIGNFRIEPPGMRDSA